MQIRIAPSLGALEGHPNDIWGTETYKPDFDAALKAPCLFFGLYGFKDFQALWNHKGEKHILWAGSDIRHFLNGYWLDDKGDIRLETTALVLWIIENCTSWVENQVEHDALMRHGILSHIVPSFLGKVEDFPLYFLKQDKVRLYTSVSGNDFKLYGWDKIPALAVANPDIEFHCYGNTIETPLLYYNPVSVMTDVLDEMGYPATSPPPNVFVHGRVPKEQMNEEIKSMTGALRLTEFDGFSEILAKSVLMGQWPVSLIAYPHMLQPHEIKTLKYKNVANLEGREYYLSVLNKYPWNLK